MKPRFGPGDWPLFQVLKLTRSNFVDERESYLSPNVLGASIIIYGMLF